MEKGPNSRHSPLFSSSPEDWELSGVYDAAAGLDVGDGVVVALVGGTEAFTPRLRAAVIKMAANDDLKGERAMLCLQTRNSREIKRRIAERIGLDARLGRVVRQSVQE